MIKPYYGFTNDVVFGWVMDNKEFCMYLIQIIIPELKIKDIEYVNRQHDVSTPDASRDVRLDILVKDTGDRLYDIEMQVAKEQDLGARMRYYQSKIDSYALRKGKSFHELKESFVIFLCDFDPFGFGKLRYSFSNYEDELGKECKLNDKSQRIIINSKGNNQKISKDLQALVDLMNGRPKKLNKHFDYAIKEIEKINASSEKRRTIMTFEEKLNEVRYEGMEKGKAEGIAVGERKGKVLGKALGKTEAVVETYYELGQDRQAALTAVKKLNLISNQEAEELVDKVYGEE